MNHHRAIACALTAAAVAAAAPAASAQSSLTVYGVADAGLVLERGGAAGPVQALSSGVASGSRIGFKGREDFGDGVSAAFVLENGHSIDTGTAAQGGLLFGRQAYVALTSSTLGAISAGRQYAPYYKALCDVADPFELGFAGNAMNVIAATSRVDNALAYKTPRAGGFSGDVLYGFGEAPGTAARNRTVSAAVSYEAPDTVPLTVVLAHYQRDNPAATARSRSTMLAARYRAGSLTTHASLSHNRDLLQRSSNDLLIGATLVTGQGRWMASAIVHRDQSAAGQDARQLAIGYSYRLSRRTDLYTAYAHIGNLNGAAFHVGNATDSGTGTAGFNLGVRHVF